MGTSGDEATTLPSAAGAGPQLARGQAIGRYLVLEAVGSGSMGVVYAAWDPSLDRKVALKLVRRTGDDEVLDARLLREAKALARLSHPNVVGVHDAGIHESQVFLAMEFVEGVTLGQWLQQRPRPWEQVLAVFLGAGEGLAAAHRAQLVHRDFKPENVLVEPSGRARVTDFGLARDATAPATLESAIPRTEASAFVTREGSLTGTPAYMSPEQFRGQSADARSDQFSFCIALYEGLWGHRPFEGKSLGELEAAVLQGRLIPPPPSKVPRRVREAVLRGLATEPAARHPNLEALLEELRAKPLVTTARVTIGVAVVAALVAGGALWARESKLRCTGAETKLRGVWNAERRRVAEAAFVATKAPGAESAAQRAFDALDAYASAWVTMHTEACRATRVTGEQSEAVMDRRMRCLARRRDELDAQAALFEKATPEIVARAAQAAGALSVLAPCADLEALRVEEPAIENAALASRVAELRRAVADVKALKSSGRYAKAIERAEALLPEVRTLGYQPLLAELLFQLGEAQEPAGQLDAAEKSFEAAVFEGEACRHDEVVALASIRLVLVTGSRRGKPDASRVWEKHASAAIARLGSRPELEADLNDHAASTLMAQRKPEEALARHRVALQLREKALGPAHPYVAASLNNMANALAELGRLDEAEAAYRRARDVYERALGPEHPRVAMAWDNLANVFDARGDMKQLAETAEKGLALRERVLPAGHPEIAISLIHVAVAQSFRGEHAAAISGMERAVQTLSAGPGPTHPLTLEAMAYLGDALGAAGRHAEALEQFEKVLCVEVPPSIRLRAQVGAATQLQVLGKTTEAAARLEDALRGAVGQPPSLSQARGSLLLGRLVWARGDRVRAKMLVEQAREACVKSGSNALVLAEIDSALELMKTAQ
ncbi:MAG: serine/threonine protein kinase [Archangiaceae bacterium]|nr:serine/threonine protein kinase [Archangiaceae bacterium]